MKVDGTMKCIQGLDQADTINDVQRRFKDYQYIYSYNKNRNRDNVIHWFDKPDIDATCKTVQSNSNKIKQYTNEDIVKILPTVPNPIFRRYLFNSCQNKITVTSMS